MPLTLRIERELFELFPDFCIRCVAVNKVANIFDQSELLSVSKVVYERCGEKYSNVEDVAADNVVASWRMAYKNVGMRPSYYRSSLESLLRRAVSRGFESTGIASVDYYNYISLLHGAPFGAYDCSKLLGDEIVFRYIDATKDTFISAGAEVKMPKTGVCYASDNSILCLGFNFRDSIVASLENGVDQILFFTESVTKEQDDNSRMAVEFLCKDIKRRGGSVLSSAVLSKGMDRICI